MQYAMISFIILINALTGACILVMGFRRIRYDERASRDVYVTNKTCLDATREKPIVDSITQASSLIVIHRHNIRLKSLQIPGWRRCGPYPYTGLS
ncbi:hypothetical protein Tcan_14636 [Toxocara canis]|uniref:Uncharacterized protein n=1 Tax=Toxocara canis TaxID=6265 RepID=A0A0B2VCS8_TOXCA|nr:hypothetical protein Tcan_14636 [Toxocara canis]